MGFECESDKNINTAYDIFIHVTPSDIQSQTYKCGVYILPTETNKKKIIKKRETNKRVDFRSSVFVE